MSARRFRGSRLGLFDGLDDDKLEPDFEVIHRPTEAMLADARRRNSAERSLTSWICRDPAPGQSALDKRNAAPALAQGRTPSP